VNVDLTSALATWREDAPALFGDDYARLRAALLQRDADLAVRILDDHGQLDRLLPILDDLEAVERAAAHDELLVVRTVDAQSLSQHWGVTADDLAAVDEFS
jgi:hypothetical protein